MQTYTFCNVYLTINHNDLYWLSEENNGDTFSELLWVSSFFFQFSGIKNFSDTSFYLQMCWQSFDPMEHYLVNGMYTEK